MSDESIIRGATATPSAMIERQGDAIYSTLQLLHLFMKILSCYMICDQFTVEAIYTIISL